ncbi:hypothetical protein BOTBODRAFT_108134 [Botryobasidium botryosum FD-172 SS1]|uniref:Dolichol-phosphate mannosyltransferase subunit 3 n=1 Tax=Botryobasidium botryosum (strain FD-172 SS1) TaxID=930990 RepID=A0A067MVJ4_BOTB1|nr:hypothetical protein BOTBODRAFT_108134 [Botryobasidium botryosum FD-172 SS1]
MTRAQRFFTLSSAFALAYGLVFFSFIQIPLLSQETQDQIIPVIPWWLLVSFGSYSLGTLGLGLLTFGDCPAAHQELLHEISEAKNDLRSRGISVD